jgi:hypothetical protein
MKTINILAGLSNLNPLLIVAVLVWSLVWKGLALWKSAGLRQKYWFIAILVINTLGILEIIYLFFVARKYKVEIVEER